MPDGVPALTETPRRRPTVALESVAAEDPTRGAIWSDAGDRTFGELNAQANRFARVTRARGLTAGDSVALVCVNRPEFVEVLYGSLRAGLRLTPINWHLSAQEIAYILDDCEAKALVAHDRFAATAAEAVALTPGTSVCLAVGGAIDGFDDYAATLEGESDENLEDPAVGGTMLYTSGTTGRPKGVYRERRPTARSETVSAARYVGGQDVHLCTGPAYHAAPLGISISGPLLAGVGVVLMDGWDPEETLRLVEARRVTHTHMVPTMFHRLLSLPQEVRTRYDLSSLRYVVHGAAPCPVEVKRALIEWLGPIVTE